MPQPQLDLRGLPVWERPALVLDAFDTLAPGETLTLVTENEPRGLYAGIAQARKDQAIFDPTRIAQSEWHVRLTRTAEYDAITPFAVLGRTLPFGTLPPEAIARVAAVSVILSARRG